LNALQLLDGMFAADSPRHLVLFRDLQLHLDQSDPMIVRRIKDILRLAKASGHSIILLDFRLKLPPELENEITHVDFRRLDPARLGVVLDGILKSAKLKAPHDAIRETALQSALGLTTTEAENAFALSVVETKGIDHEVVAREKARTLKKNGLVEFVEATTSLDDIGGLGLLKEWLMRRGGAFGASAKTYGLPAPKGLLIVGIPGTGKSLTAKATAGAFGNCRCCVSTWDASSAASLDNRNLTYDPSSKPPRPSRRVCCGWPRLKKTLAARKAAAPPKAAHPPGFWARS
jgi:SpoVK/Ycf46/Vps4 family AAA+-type ATPase